VVIFAGFINSKLQLSYVLFANYLFILFHTARVSL